VIDPLPAEAFEASNAFPKVQNEEVPVMFAAGNAFTVTTKAADV